MEYIISSEGMQSKPFNKRDAAFKQRNVFHEVLTYLHDETASDICILNGLRNTGKTTLMAQAVQSLPNLDSICWMHAEDDNSIQDIKTVIEQEPQCRYFFIDNITKLDDFMDASSILADRYVAEQHRKIVLTGDDSLSLYLASVTELEGRTRIIHTTPMFFDEYRRLMGTDKSIDDYLEHGGILSNCGLSINKDRDFDYAEAAIAWNIQNSLERFRNGGSFGPLLPLYAEERLVPFIQAFLRDIARRIVLQAVSRHKLSLEMDYGREVVFAAERKLQQIEVPSYHAQPRAVYELRRYLEEMDVIRIAGKSENQQIHFVQPALCYCLICRQIKSLTQGAMLKLLPPSKQRNFCTELIGIVKEEMKHIYLGNRDSSKDGGEAS